MRSVVIWTVEPSETNQSGWMRWEEGNEEKVGVGWVPIISLSIQEEIHTTPFQCFAKRKPPKKK